MAKRDYVISHLRVAGKFGRRSGAAGARALATVEAPAVSVALGGVADVEEDAPDLLAIRPPTAVQAHAAMAACEQLGAEMGLQHADAVSDGGRGDAELAGGADEALVAGGGLEESQAVERREGFRGIGDVWLHCVF